jgi:hypothetical protein
MAGSLAGGLRYERSVLVILAPSVVLIGAGAGDDGEAEVTRSGDDASWNGLRSGTTRLRGRAGQFGSSSSVARNGQLSGPCWHCRPES